MTELVVEACGPLTSLQDGGRPGYQRFGVSPSGAMDRRSLAMANILVGNRPDEAAIEFANLGGRFAAAGGDLCIAVAGAGCTLSIDGSPVPPSTGALLRDGQTAEIGHARTGTFAYLAVAGGFAVAPQLGSLSYHLRSRMGGLDGRALAPGSRLPCRQGGFEGELRQLSAELPAPDDPIRVMLGPQDDYFTPEAVHTFLNGAFTVTAQADRMGFQLAGPPLAHAKGFNIVSDGIVTGHIQVPGSGQPIVLMRDRQTAGGYPKIATVISADIDRLAQMRPGSSVRFEAVEREAAAAAARGLRDWIDRLPDALSPVRFALTSEHLLSRNLIGGAVDALAP